MAQWITRLTTDQKIAGSNPARLVFFSFFSSGFQWDTTLNNSLFLTIKYSLAKLCNNYISLFLRWTLMEAVLNL